MHVGYMRNCRTPPEFVKLLAKTTKYHGIDLVFFHPEDIDMERKTVKGKILFNNKWVKKEVPVPKFTDVTVYSFKYKKQIAFLRKHSHFTTGRLANKETGGENIKADGEFAHLVIPTIPHTDFSGFYDFLKKHQRIVMKPKRGQRGEGIFMLGKKGNKFILSYEKEEEVLSKMKLKKFFRKTLSNRPYIYQKYIESKTKFGDPFDCRIRLEKNGKGKWEVVINLIRIGSGQKVVSNVARGGSVSELDPFLKTNYGDKWEEIKSSILNIGKRLPYKLEKMYNQELGSLGIDIGIDRDGKLYLFESNNAPGVEFGEGPIAMVKCDYYKYMLDKINDKEKGENR